MNKNKDFTEQEFKDIQAESHQWSKTYSEAMETYERKEEKLEEQSIAIFNSILTSAGVVAGFGFAAFGNVKNLWIFFFGELLLLSTIVYGLWILFSYKKSKGKYYREAGDSWHNYLQPRLEMYKSFLTLKISKTKLYEKLSEDDSRLLSGSPKINSNVTNLDQHYFVSIILLTLGSVLLLISFFRICV